MNTTCARKSPSMVLICSACKSSDRLVSRWNQSGQRLSAVVIANPKPGKLLSSAMTRLRESGTPVFQVEHPVHWPQIETALGSVPTELLVCYGFMRLIPTSFLRLFTHGGVNFHPALLPAYPGPHPTQCLVSDGAFGRFGGLTLHTLTESFDQGDILAQAKFLPQDYRSVSAFRGVFVSTMLDMIKNVLPPYCSGQIKTKRQSKHALTWAKCHPRCILITKEWTFDEIVASCAFLRGCSGLFVRLADGTIISITGFRKRLEMKNWQPESVNPVTLDFDCADSRVSVFRNTRLGRFARRISLKIEKFHRFDTPRPVEFEIHQSD